MNWKTVFKSLKNKDMQKRLFGVALLIVIFRFLAHVPIPLAEPAKLKDIVANAINSTDLGGVLNLLSGGSLTTFSIVLIGVSPFITASIITQLVTKAIPSLEEASRDGEAASRKINQWTRVIAVPISIIQSIAYIFILRSSTVAGNTVVLESTSILEWVVAVTAMSAGSILVMWIGELITEKGVGNGISLLVFVGIASGIPSALASSIISLTDTSAGSLNVFNWFTLPLNPVYSVLAMILAVVGVILLYILVKINEAQRIITINYAKRVHGNSAYGGIKSILPLKLVAGGVMPVIFAVAFLSLPSLAGQLMKSSNFNVQFADKLITWFQAPNPGTFRGETWEAFIYPIAYFLLIVMFTYFYSSLMFNSEEIADNLQKQGGFIDGVRPGKTTAGYLSKIVNHLNLFGAVALGLIAVTPFIFDYLIHHLASIPGTNLSIGGTSFFLAVSIALETLRQINSRALMVTYDEYK